MLSKKLGVLHDCQDIIYMQISQRHNSNLLRKKKKTDLSPIQKKKKKQKIHVRHILVSVLVAVAYQLLFFLVGHAT